MPELGVRLGEFWVELERPRGGGQRLGKQRTRGAAAEHRQHGVAVRKARIGERKAWVTRDGLFEVWERVREAGTARAGEAGPAGDVQLIGLGVIGRVLTEEASIAAREFLDEGGGRALGDRVLDREDVGQPLIKPVGPELASAADVDQPH